MRKKRLRLLAVCVFSFLTCFLLNNAFAAADTQEQDSVVLSETAKYDISISRVSDEIIPADENHMGRFSVDLDISGVDVNLKDSYIELTTNSDRVDYFKVSDFSVESGHNVSYNNKTITFNELKGGDKINFNVLVYFDEGVVYNGYELPVNAKFYSSDGELLASASQINFKAYVPAPNLSKSASSSEAGVSEDGYIVKPKPVVYSFSTTSVPLTNGKARHTTKLVIEDTLPTYTDKEGNTQVAQVDPSTSSKWKVSSDKKKVTLEVPSSGTYQEGYWFGDLPQLKLLFPGAKVGETVVNNATATFTPRRPYKNEPALTADASSKITLKASTLENPLNIPFTKYVKSGNREVYNTPDGKKAAQIWNIDFNNRDERKVNSLSLQDTPQKELYITSFMKSEHESNTNKVLEYVDHIEGWLDDGTHVENVAYKKRETGWFRRKLVALDIEEPQKYVSLKLVFQQDRDFGKGSDYSNYELRVATKFRDPDSIFSGQYKNEAVLEGKSSDGNTSFKKIGTDYIKVKDFTYPFKFNVVKSYNYNKNELTEGEAFQITVTPLNQVVPNSSIKNRKIVALLPDCVDLQALPFESDAVYGEEYWSFISSTLKYKVVEDYHGSGYRAVVIDVPDLKKSNYDNTFDTAIKISLKTNQYLTYDKIDIPVYYSFEGINNADLQTGGYPACNAKMVDDEFNVSDGQSSQVAVASVSYNKPMPNKVTGGQTLIGRDQGHLSPYSIDLENNVPFKLSMKVHNFESSSQDGLVMYTILPHVGDKVLVPNSSGVYTDRGSNSDVILTSAVDVPEGYTAYYLSSMPDQNADIALHDEGWTTTPEDYSRVKAVKVVANPGTKIESNESVEAILDVVAQTKSSSPFLVGSFAYNTKQHPIIVEANKVIATLPESYVVNKRFVTPDNTDITSTPPEDIKLPDSVSIDVFKQNEDGSNKSLVKTITISKDDNWSTTLSDLPAYEGSNKLVYSFVEKDIDSWSADYKTEGKKTTITNTFKVPTTNIDVSKVWVDGEGNSPQHPEVEVALLANDKQVATVKLNAENSWKASFDDQPLIDGSGKKIDYRVEELNTPEYFDVTVEGDVTKGFVLTNTFKVPTTNIDVSKVWVDGEGNSPQHPEVEVALLANDKQVATVKLNAENSWKASFDDQPLIDGSGKKIVYSVEELNTPEYFDVTVEGDVTKGFVLTNTFKVPTTNILVSKVWVDGEGNSPQHPEVEVALLANDKQVATVKLNAENSWKASFDDQPLIDGSGKKIDYRVEELNTPEYFDVTVEGDVTKGFVLTNTFKVPTTNILVSKVWVDGEGNSPQHPEVELALLANDKQVATVKLNAENSWKASFDDQPLIDGSGKKIDYRVEELNTPEHFDVTVEGDVTKGFVLTNTFKVPTTNILVSKVWVDGEGNSPQHPEVEVALLANDKQVATVKLNAENSWKASFDNQPLIDGSGKKIDYSVEELNTPEYFDVTVEGDVTKGFVLTNTYLGTDKVPGNSNIESKPKKDRKKKIIKLIPDTGDSAFVCASLASILAMNGLIALKASRRK